MMSDGTIPEDVMEAALEVSAKIDDDNGIWCNGMDWNLNEVGVEIIARAIQMERERCAQAADKIASDDREEAKERAKKSNYHAANHWNAHADGCEEVATTIRTGARQCASPA